MRTVWFAAVLGICGCASPRAPTYVTLPPPPPESVRAQVGTGLSVTTNEATTIEFTQPMGKGRSAGHGGWVGFWSAPAYGAAAGDAYGAIAGLFLSPVTGTAGALYGAIAGMSKAEYEQVCATLRQTIQRADLPGRLQTAVTDSLRRLTTASPNGQPNANQAILELSPTLIRLGGAFEIEPPLIFECAVRVRLLRATDGLELHSTEFRYAGRAHKLRDWAAHDGAFLRDELTKTCADLPELIVEQLFLVYPLPDSPAQQRVLPWPPPKQR